MAWRGALAAFVWRRNAERDDDRRAPSLADRWLQAVRAADRRLPATLTAGGPSHAPQLADRSLSAPCGDAGGVMLRTAGPEDLPALQTFVEGLSPASRSRRFFTPRKDLPAFLARALTERDARHRFVVAVDACTPRSPIVALAQYARLATRPAGELALVVADAWQGHGLGALLLQRLLDDARAGGLTELEAEVLPENRAMLALARRFGFAVDAHPDDPRLLRILLDLEPAGASLPAAPTRAPLVAALRPARCAACV